MQVIGPRGKDTGPGTHGADDTYFDLGAENKQENPPALFEPKTLEHRLALAEMRALLPQKPSGFGEPEKALLSRSARRLAAEAILSDDCPVAHTEAETGREVADALRTVLGKPSHYA